MNLPRRMAAGGAGRVLRAGAATPGTLPIGGTASFAVSARAVREGVGAWAATRSADRRPDGLVWRDGLAVASAIVEAAHALLPSGAGDEPGAGPRAPWDVSVPVPREPQDLVRRTYLRGDRVRTVVDLLVSARVLDLVERTGDEWQVRLRSSVFEDAPVLAVVAWDAVRTRLGPTAGSPAALALVRELARRTSPGTRAGAHFERLTFIELGELTGFGKSALRTGLSACIRAQLLEARTRERVASYYRLLPAVFGRSDALRADSVDASGGAATAGEVASDTAVREFDAVGIARRSHIAAVDGVQVQPHRTPADPSPPARGAAPVDGAMPVPSAVSQGSRSVLPGSGAAGIDSATSPAHATAAALVALVIEVNGVPVPLPSGARPVLEQDDTGAYWYRIGAMRLGPISLG